MDQKISDAYSRILKKELVAAMGCTEPIAIAYAAAKCREVLGSMPTSCKVACSGNIVKNVMGVTVPNSGGMKGIDVAAVLGILAVVFLLDGKRCRTRKRKAEKPIAKQEIT